MKTIKTLITLLLLVVCTAVDAQTVVIEKTDGTKDEYKLSEVDSVVYEPATKYYYYAGWTLPTNEEELAKLAVSPNGGEVDMSKTYSSSNVLYDYTLSGNGVKGTYSTVYVVIPNTMKIYDADKNDNMSAWTLQGTIGEHNIYASVDPFSNVDYIIIF